MVRLLPTGHETDVQMYTVLTDLRNEDGAVVHCKCCDTNVARVDGVAILADLDKASNVMILDTIDQVYGTLSYSYDRLLIIYRRN